VIERKDFTPRPYQHIALDHLLSHERCALWAGMGMGKTIGTLNALDALFLSGENRPALVLGPLRVARSTWPNETLKWNHLRHISVMPIVGTEQERLAALRRDCSVYSINYDNLVWLVEHFGDRWPFGTVVADEATRLKGLRLSDQVSKKGKEFTKDNGGGKRANALGRIAHTLVDRFWQLTGTPAPNGLIDLWGQLWLLDRGRRLGRTHTAFKERWFRPKLDGYGTEPLEFAEQQIYGAIGDICLTLDPKDWFDLKDPIVNNVYVDLGPRARKLYKDMDKEMFLEIEGHKAEAFNAAARTQKTLQISSGAVYVDPLVESDHDPRSKLWKLVHDEKIYALDSIREETGGAPLIVCYEFKSDLARLLKAFPQGRTMKTPKDEEDFKAGKIPMLFIHPKSGGHGVDGLQEKCNNIVFFSVSWNLEERMQVIERIGPVRQIQSGFNRPVWVHNIIDELVLERVVTKRAVQDLLLDAMNRRR
jgi:SNF2 family DNA or RNA helicase